MSFAGLNDADVAAALAACTGKPLVDASVHFLLSLPIVGSLCLWARLYIAGFFHFCGR